MGTGAANIMNIPAASLSATGVFGAVSGGSDGTIDTSAADWVVFQFSGTWVGVIQVECSFDKVSWSPVSILNQASGAVAVNAQSNGMYVAQTMAPYSRIRVTTYTSGQINLVGGNTDLKSSPLVSPVNGGSGLAVVSTPTPGANGSYSQLAATTNATLVKGSGGNLFQIDCTNGSAATIYLKLFNKASVAVPGTDFPALVFPIAAGATLAQDFGPLGKRFNVGLTYAVTAAASDADATAIGAGAKLGLTWN